MSKIEQMPDQLYDMDHVRIGDGRIYRVLGNFALDGGDFLGYNLYSPDVDGDRTFRGEPYTKNYTEDTRRPADVLDTYDILQPEDVVEYFDPIEAAKCIEGTYDGTVWAHLYGRLADIFGRDSVGVFGSALPGDGMHLNPDGTIKNDVDFFINGLGNVPILGERLHEVREDLGFTDYTDSSLEGIARAWTNVFRHPNNSLAAIMARRWSGMQFDDGGRIVLNTFRFRDTAIIPPPQLLAAERILARNVEVEGVAVDTVGGNLYPRAFTIDAVGKQVPVYSFWWKFSSPVAEQDRVAVCGDVLDVDGQEVMRLTNYDDHWIKL